MKQMRSTDDYKRRNEKRKRKARKNTKKKRNTSTIITITCSATTFIFLNRTGLITVITIIIKSERTKKAATRLSFPESFHGSPLNERKGEKERKEKKYKIKRFCLLARMKKNATLPLLVVLLLGVSLLSFCATVTQAVSLRKDVVRPKPAKPQSPSKLQQPVLDSPGLRVLLGMNGIKVAEAPIQALVSKSFLDTSLPDVVLDPPFSYLPHITNSVGIARQRTSGHRRRLSFVQH